MTSRTLVHSDLMDTCVQSARTSVHMTLWTSVHIYLRDSHTEWPYTDTTWTQVYSHFTETRTQSHRQANSHLMATCTQLPRGHRTQSPTDTVHSHSTDTVHSHLTDIVHSHLTDTVHSQSTDNYSTCDVRNSSTQILIHVPAQTNLASEPRGKEIQDYSSRTVNKAEYGIVGTLNISVS
jgi:hypothetical protein